MTKASAWIVVLLTSISGCASQRAGSPPASASIDAASPRSPTASLLNVGSSRVTDVKVKVDSVTNTRLETAVLDKQYSLAIEETRGSNGLTTSIFKFGPLLSACSGPSCENVRRYLADVLDNVGRASPFLHGLREPDPECAAASSANLILLRCGDETTNLIPGANGEWTVIRQFQE